MAYTTKDASNTLFRYLNITEQSIKFIENTSKRGFIYNTASGERCVIFIYPISHKADDSKNFFDTRDSGAYERGVSWNYALQNKLKYFCFAVHDQVEKYKDYIFSLECQERIIEKVSGTLNGSRIGVGTQVVIPNDYIPNKQFERILTKNGFFIAVIHKSNIIDYIDKYDNRPYLIDNLLVDLDEPETVDEDSSQSAEVDTGYLSKLSRNRILFGAPGTGKSYKLNDDREKCFTGDNYERVTFHPNYSYAQFVGTYKPKPKFRTDGTEYVSYEFVPGPFLRIWINAQSSIKSGTHDNHLLIIEEINRANVAAVFGDVFQLLDRKIDGTSEYEIATSEDMRDYLEKEHGFTADEVATIRIPNNMYIWATMNSADQGVSPMDSAFKRRWNFEYIGIDEGKSKIAGKKITLKPYGEVEWDVLRAKINDRLTQSDLNINEDKLIGPFFFSEKEIISESIDEIFKSKLLMYLFEDVLKHRKGKLFRPELNTFSKIIDAYNNSEEIFDFEVISLSSDESIEEERALSLIAENSEEYSAGNE